jgi:hypothetical protein
MSFLYLDATPSHEAHGVWALISLTNDEVENPVTECGQSHTLGTSTEREDLSGKQPRHGTPCGAVYNIVQHDECVLAVGTCLCSEVCFGGGADDSKEYFHQDTTKDKKRATAPVIGKVPCGDGGGGVWRSVCGGVEERLFLRRSQRRRVSMGGRMK